MNHRADFDDLEKVLSIGRNPEQDVRTMIEDLCMRWRQQGVGEHSIEGVQIAMMIAFRLGERAGISNTIKALKEGNG